MRQTQITRSYGSHLPKTVSALPPCSELECRQCNCAVNYATSQYSSSRSPDKPGIPYTSSFPGNPIQGFNSPPVSSYPVIPCGVTVSSGTPSRDIRSSSPGTSAPTSAPAPEARRFASSRDESEVLEVCIVIVIWSLSSTKSDCNRRLCTDSL